VTEPSIFQKGAASDTAGREGDRQRSAASVTLECDLPGLPCDERNLVVKIAMGFANEVTAGCVSQRQGSPMDSSESVPSERTLGAQGVPTAVRATLHKRIPMGAGLGGGSSDAARALLGLNQLWGTARAANELSAFAARFGSDLPFFLHGPSSVCRGRGEIVQPIGKPRPGWAVLILPEIVMPTADVYRRFDAMGLGREQDLRDEPDWHEWKSLESAALLPRLINDLEPAAFDISPQLGDLRSRHEKLLGRIVRMSGSGSSLFTLFDEEGEAKEASAWLQSHLKENAPAAKVVAAELSPNFMDDLNVKFAIE
jgi:4-diphosphocytidyl-2C-methyl-D-erythritol kinase